MTKIAPVFGGYQNTVGEAKAGKIGENRLVPRVIHLVDDEDHRWLGLAEFLSQRLIHRREAVLRIHHQQD